MIAWILLVLAIAVSLMLGVERLLARLGIQRADPEAASHGLRDVVEFLRQRRR